MGLPNTSSWLGFDLLDPAGAFRDPAQAKIPAYQEQFAKDQAARAGQLAAVADAAARQYHESNPLLNGALTDTVNPYNNPVNNGPNGLIANAQRVVSGQAGQTISAPAQASLADTAAAGRAIAGSDAATAAAQTADTQGLRLAASGLGGPSAAESLAQDVLQRNIQSQAALAAKARGGNIAAAMRTASTSGTQQALQSQAQLAALRAQEQATARGQLVGADQGARAADQSRAAATAGALGQVSGQQVGLAGTNAGLVTAGLSGLNAGAQTFQQGTGQQLQLATQQAAAEQAYLDYLQRQYATASGIPAGQAGTLGNLSIANQQADQQARGAKASTAANLITAII